MPVSVFQRNDIGVSAWITSAEGMECLVGQGFAPLGVRIGVSAWINLARPQAHPHNFGDSLSAWPARGCLHRWALPLSAMACDLVTGEICGNRLPMTCTDEHLHRSDSGQSMSAGERLQLVQKLITGCANATYDLTLTSA